jgi:transposase
LVFVTAARQTEWEAVRARRVSRRKKRNKTGGKVVLQRLKEKGTRIARLHTIWVDGGFTGDTFMMWVMDLCHWVVQVVLRPLEHKGFVLLPKRWVVERTFGWLSWCRRLSRDHEGLPETSPDVDLYCDDSDYGSSSGMISYPSPTFQTASELEMIKRDDRLDTIAKDIVYHFPRRGYLGKGLVVSVDKFTAVKMYEKVRYHWKEEIKNLTGRIGKSSNDIEYQFKDANSPLRLVFVFQYLRGVINSIIERTNIDSIDLKISELLDRSVVADDNAISQPEYKILPTGKILDLSKIDYDKLKTEFKLAPYKNIQIADLRSFIENKLDRMLQQNTTRTDFAQRLQFIIDRYNAGGSATENYYEALVDFAPNLKQESERHLRETGIKTTRVNFESNQQLKKF